MNTQKGFASILIILLAMVAFGGGMYAYDQKYDLGIFDNKDNIEETTFSENTLVTNDENKQSEPNIKIAGDIYKSEIVEDKKTSLETQTKITTELKSGTQTKIIGSTSTTITMVGKDFQSTTTISKEEEDYFTERTTYKCGNKDCFEKNFQSCLADSVKTNIGGFMGSTYYEIKGKTQQGCNLLFKYTEYPEPSWVNKEMICEVDNSLNFESATMDMFQLVSSGELECKGELYDILSPKF